MRKHDEDPLTEVNPDEEPEVYAVSREESGVQFSRREFVELAGTAAAGAALVSGLTASQKAEAQRVTPTGTPTRTPTGARAQDPCTVRTETDDVQVHVGPGRHRGIRMYMPVGEDIPVIGQGIDLDDNLWWQIEIPNIEQAWVADEDVTLSGDCSAVGVSPTPPIVTAAPNETATPQPTDVPPGQPGTVPEGQTGINYRVDGQTFTLPCGSPIPAGAVCTCNCVTVPASCGCDRFSSCSCVGASHYWYPN